MGRHDCSTKKTAPFKGVKTIPPQEESSPAKPPTVTSKHSAESPAVASMGASMKAFFGQAAQDKAPTEDFSLAQFGIEPLKKIILMRRDVH